MPIHIPSDTIHFNSISTGGNSAGNGGAGVNTGNIIDNAHISFNPTNTATGADVNVHTGNDVDQNAHSGFASGNHSVIGPDTSAVHADTTAYQTNFLAADMSQTVMAGIGGNGGNGNTADGGDVHVHA
jgi:hypothetical protein